MIVKAQGKTPRQVESSLSGEGKKVVAGCVAENNAKYLDQALRLLRSWRWFGGALADCDFTICVVGDDIPASRRREFADCGARILIVDRFSPVHAQSNKLRFLELPHLQDADRIILLDCDTIVVQEPSGLLCDEDLAAKTADCPTVPHKVFESLFAFFRLDIPSQSARCTVRGEPTIPYFNAGVLSLSRRAIASLVPRWIQINRTLAENLHLLGDSANFCEQASLALALAPGDCSIAFLGNELNFPAHFDREAPDSDFGQTDPVIIHYHWLTDQNGFLAASPYMKVAARIDDFNARLRDKLRAPFDNRHFWDERYSHDPSLGSGRGSRGVVAQYKKALLRSVVEELRPGTIHDIGCGDMEVSSSLPDDGYLGIDISPVVIGRNQIMFPGKNFACADFGSREFGHCDLSVCLDLLIHTPSLDDYLALVRKIVRSSRFGIVAAYEEFPAQASDITFFHEPASKTLRDAGAEQVTEIGAYNQVKVLMFSKNPATPQDSGAEQSRLRRPIFLVGAMRSGTTLLAELLGQSPYVAHCPFELKDLWSRVGKVSMASPRTRDTECDELDSTAAANVRGEELAESFLERMSSLSGKKGNAAFLNKNPHLCNKLELVDALFPDARYIWIHRNLPRVAASLVRLFRDVLRRQNTRHIWPWRANRMRNRCWLASYDGIPVEGVPADRIFPGGDIRYLAEYWLEANRAAADFLVQRNCSRYAVVKQETLLADPENTLARIFGALRLPFHSVDSSAVQADRNATWRTDLGTEEIEKLRHFARENRKEIDRVLANFRDLSDLWEDLFSPPDVPLDGVSGTPCR